MGISELMSANTNGLWAGTCLCLAGCLTQCTWRTQVGMLDTAASFLTWGCP